MKNTKHIVELSKLVCIMTERGATEEELSNVGEFFKAVMTTKLECDNIYEFQLLNKYRNKYCK